MAFLIVWAVFRDPAIDYRLVMAGALVPDLIDAPMGGARLAHTLAAAVASLAVVMLSTRRRRLHRRRWLALPIGWFVHQLVDATWTRANIFWWPALGGSLTGRLPALDHGPVVLAAEEILGAIALLWCVRRFGLSEPTHRATFLRTGRLRRDLDGARPH